MVVQKLRVLKFNALQCQKILLDVSRLEKDRHYFVIVLLALVYIVETHQVTIVLAQLTAVNCDSVIYQLL